MSKDEKEVKLLTKSSLKSGVSVVFRYLVQYRSQIILLSILGILSAIGNGVIPYISGKFFDSIGSIATVNLWGQTLPLFVTILVIWVIVQSVTYIVDWRSTTLSEIFSNAIWFDYLTRGFSYLLELPIGFHKKNKIGDIGNQINIAGNALETIAGRFVIDLSPQILTIVIAIGIAFWLKPLLAIFLLSGLMIYIFIMIRKIRPLAVYQKKYRAQIRDYFGDAYDSIENTLAIKQATAEGHERAKLQKSGQSALPHWLSLTKVWSGLALYQRFVILTTQLIVFILSVYYIRDGTMTLGELLAFNAYAAMLFGPFVTIGRNWHTIQNGLINIEETEKILKMDPENYHPEDAEKFEIKGGIVFKNVYFQYEQGKSVLEDISFEVRSGQVVALVGESGVGKSTLVDLISGYHFPDQGEIKIDGHEIHKVNLYELRTKIAVVPQEVVLFNDTIEMNIKYGNFKSTEDEMKEAAKKAYATDFIEKFPKKWEQLVGERGIKLSVGQKQRVSIARAILRNPSILILDEPTSALDAGTEKIITDSLDELMKGRTTFIIAHRLSTVRRADLILVFKDGRIIERGKHDELLQFEAGEYRRLYELQIGLHK